MASRGQAVRTLAGTLSRETGIDVEASFEAPDWRLQWPDGPTYETMRRLAAEHADRHVDVAGLRLDRIAQPEAFAAQAIRLALGSGLPFGVGRRATTDLLLRIEAAVDATDYPERTGSPREAAMAERLLHAGDRIDQHMAALLADHDGVAWLLPTPSEHEVADDPHVAMELLTARYATGTGAQQWRRHLTVSDDAVTAAHADQDACPLVRLALVVLVIARRRRVQGELDAEELQALEAARAKDPVQWPLLGRAMGTSRQNAQQELARLRRGAPRRRAS
jgi:hypothetical protein